LKRAEGIIQQICLEAETSADRITIHIPKGMSRIELGFDETPVIASPKDVPTSVSGAIMPLGELGSEIAH
jgi:hypothetical protein